MMIQSVPPIFRNFRLMFVYVSDPLIQSQKKNVRTVRDDPVSFGNDPMRLGFRYWDDGSSSTSSCGAVV